ncbi:MAG TPA: hypothetical protein VEV15_14380 [Flavisolibacter sp.]|nr:hypothetical protein [Flavisolibacter sp.]
MVGRSQALAVVLSQVWAAHNPAEPEVLVLNLAREWKVAIRAVAAAQELVTQAVAVAVAIVVPAADKVVCNT